MAGHWHRCYVHAAYSPGSLAGQRARNAPHFFSSVLEHFVALSRCVGQWRIRLYRLGLDVQAMAPFQDRFLSQFEFAGQLSTRLGLEYAMQQQDDLGRQQLTAFKQCPAIQGVDILALTTAIDRQAAARVDAKDPCGGQAGLTMWTAEAIWMEMLLNPGYTSLGIE